MKKLRAKKRIIKKLDKRKEQGADNEKLNIKWNKNSRMF